MWLALLAAVYFTPGLHNLSQQHTTSTLFLCMLAAPGIARGGVSTTAQHTATLKLSQPFTHTHTRTLCPACLHSQPYFNPNSAQTSTLPYTHTHTPKPLTNNNTDPQAVQFLRAPLDL